MTGPLPEFGALPKQEGLRAGVARALRAAIVSGEMQPGVVYSAPSLGARFGVSATPVREAMLDLVKEGLVGSVPNKGFRVTEVSEADLDEITGLRLLIEPPTVRDVVPAIPAADLPELRRLAQDIVDQAVEGDLIAYTEADRLFHVRLLEYAGNRRLVELVSELRSHTRLFGLAPLVESGKLAESAAEHLELVELIAAGDGSGAERLMVRHIRHVRGVWAGHAGEE